MFKARKLIISCIKEIECLDRTNRKQYLLDKFRSFQVRVTKKKRMLGEKRREFRDREGREEVSNLFALHRLSAVGERKAHHDRCMEAQPTRPMFLSTIADGMQQNHCFLYRRLVW